MKTVIECKRVLMYNTIEDKVVGIFAEQYNPTLSEQDILCIIFNPNTMEWLTDSKESLWMKNSYIMLEVFCEYKEVETFSDKIKRILRI